MTLSGMATLSELVSWQPLSRLSLQQYLGWKQLFYKNLYFFVVLFKFWNFFVFHFAWDEEIWKQNVKWTKNVQNSHCFWKKASEIQSTAVRNNSSYLCAVLFVLILMIIQHFYGTKWVSRNKTSVNNIALIENENLPYNGLATVSLQFYIWDMCSASKCMSFTFFPTVNPASPVYQLTLLKLIRDKIISSCNLIPPLVSYHAVCAVE
jgi:hypothetical protein